MKVSVPALGRGDAARDRRVDHVEARGLASSSTDLARGGDVDGRAIDQQRAGLALRRDVVSR